VDAREKGRGGEEGERRREREGHWPERKRGASPSQADAQYKQTYKLTRKVTPPPLAVWAGCKIALFVFR